MSPEMVLLKMRRLAEEQCNCLSRRTELECASWPLGTVAATLGIVSSQVKPRELVIGGNAEMKQSRSRFS